MDWLQDLLWNPNSGHLDKDAGHSSFLGVKEHCRP